MKLPNISSSFENRPIERFYYPAAKQSSSVALVVKGLYGYHDPDDIDSWENELISDNMRTFDVLCINSARRDNAVKDGPVSFQNKSFTQECNDYTRSYIEYKNEGILSSETKLYAIGNSFGGTVLLSLPNILNFARGVILINAGCGRSAETTKPLLTTLPDEAELLSSIQMYTGVFAYINSGADVVVPPHSKEKVMRASSNALCTMVYTLPSIGHKLVEMQDRGTFIRTVIEHTMSVSTTQERRNV